MKKICVAIWLLTVVPCLAQDVVILQRGDVTAEKLWVGAFADVTYRGDKGKKTTANGKVRNVKRHMFTIGKGFWNEHIAFENVDQIVLGEKAELIERFKQRFTNPLMVRKEQSNTSIVVGQLLTGAGLGIGGSFVGALAGAGLGQGSGSGGEFYLPAGPILGAAVGLVLGSAVGATIASKDKLDKPPWGRALAGSLIGFGLGLKATSKYESLWPMLFVAPPVLATSFSWLGNARRYNHVTVHAGLLRNGGQGVSAVYHF